MPFFDFDPIDPGLALAGDIGPDRENRLDDRAKLASAIEKKTGAAPHAELGRYGETLIRRIRDRIEGPTIAKIATLYNSLSQDRVTDYGARVAEVYRRKLWEKKN